MSDKFVISSSPHFKANTNTTKIMGFVLLALYPQLWAGIKFFGYRAWLVTVVSIVSCVLFEYLFLKLTKQKNVISNLSACVTGAMLAMVCPPTIPLWMVILGAAVAIIVAKGLFGGIGSNVFNPASHPCIPTIGCPTLLKPITLPISAIWCKHWAATRT